MYDHTRTVKDAHTLYTEMVQHGQETHEHAEKHPIVAHDGTLSVQSVKHDAQRGE